MTENTDRQDHDRLSRILELDAKAEDVWAVIGYFGGMADWHPMIASVELTEIEGEPYRHLRTTDGDLFLQRLIETGPRHYTYETVDGPLPAADHRATLSVVPEEGGGCHVYWSAYFTPLGPDERLADQIVGKFYEIGLEALREKFA